MAKATTDFICQSCGAKHTRWQGKCNSCGEWSTLVETVTEHKNGSAKKGYIEKGLLQKLSEVRTEDAPRIKTNLNEFDRVLGGGIVPGSLTLIGGDPGIGKSTLILQVAEQVASAKVVGHRSLVKGETFPKDYSLESTNNDLRTVLYASGEESAQQIKLRGERLGTISENLLVLPETNIETIIETAKSLSSKSQNQVANKNLTLLIIDSIQTMWSEELTGSPGSVGQVTLCTSKLMEFAKKNHIATFIVGHVTKEGSIAGPKILEHLVDSVLYLEGDKLADFRVLKGVKNRFGSTNETGIFEMTEKGMVEVSNPSATLLEERSDAPGTVVFPAMEGTRAVLVEVQALTNITNFGYPKRTASGFDLNRLNVLVAVLTKRAGVNLGNQDVYVNVVGGLKIKEPALDLAICLAITSAYKNKALTKDLCAFGEVGLAGEIRGVHNAKERLKEAEKLGYKKNITAKECKNIREVINKIL